jgi:hypothetical protein
MKRVFAIIGALLLLFGAATAFAEKPLFCQLQGSYMGYPGGMQWMSTANGANSMNGTYILHIPGWNWSNFVFCGESLGATAIGSWRRTGFNTFAVTLIAYGVDSSSGNTLCIAKLDTTDTLTEDCDVLEVGEATFSIFSSTQNPFVDTPYYGTITAPSHEGFRMVAD